MLQWEVLPQTEYELFLRKWYLLKITYNGEIAYKRIADVIAKEPELLTKHLIHIQEIVLEISHWMEETWKKQRM